MKMLIDKTGSFIVGLESGKSTPQQHKKQVSNNKKEPYVAPLTRNRAAANKEETQFMQLGQSLSNAKSSKEK